MSRPRRSDSWGSTVELLRRAAEREFALHGFSAARLEDIASKVGLTRPSLLHHFSTKDLLYRSVLEGLVGRLKASLLEGMTSKGTFVERLSATVGKFVDHLYDNPLPTQLLLRELQDARGQGEQMLREQVVPLLELVETFIVQTGGDQLAPGLDVRKTLLDVVGAVTFYAIAGPIRQTLWNTTGNPEQDRAMLRAHFTALAHRLFLKGTQ